MSVAVRGISEYHGDNFIGGEWVESDSGERIDVIDPTTEKVWGHVPSSNVGDVDAAVKAADRAFRGAGWSDITAQARASLMLKLADELEARAERMAALITCENGTALSETLLAAGHAGRMLRYYAGLAHLVDQDDERSFPSDDTLYTQVLRQPRGVAALIAPWNFPVALVMVKLAPALIAGCTVVIKPASETPLDLRVLMEAATAAGIPPGVINLITCGNDVASALVEHRLVAKVAFTGSTEVGRLLAEKCGRLLRPVTLELGGKSASIVMEDADLAHFASMINRTCLRNTGQTCYNSTRILAPRAIYDQVVDVVTEVVLTTPIGDPFDPATVYGPVASAKQRDRVENYIRIGQQEGARIAVGGEGRRGDSNRGYFVRPTVFAGVSNDMRIAREEIFGPVLVVIPFDDTEHAIRLSNDSPFGLGGSIFTQDVDAAAAMAARLETGSVGINFYGSNQAAPFGGWKDSGIGVEYGPEAIAAYSRMKSIHRQR